MERSVRGEGSGVDSEPALETLEEEGRATGARAQCAFQQRQEPETGNSDTGSRPALLPGAFSPLLSAELSQRVYNPPRRDTAVVTVLLRTPRNSKPEMMRCV
eukprot:3627236-Rhodomonas_salina.3